MTLRVRRLSDEKVYDVLIDERHIDGSVKVGLDNHVMWLWLDVPQNFSGSFEAEIVEEDDSPNLGQPTLQQAGYLDGWLRLKAESMDDDYILGYSHGAYARATGKHDA